MTKHINLIVILFLLGSTGSGRADDRPPSTATTSESRTQASQEAAADNGVWYNPFSGYSAPIPDGFAPYASLGGEVLYGGISSANDDTAPSVSMAVYGVEGVLAARWRYLVAGLGWDYKLLKQLTGLPDARNVNMKGHALSFGPALGVTLGLVNIVGRYNLFSEYRIDQLDRENQRITYSSPTSFAVAVQVRNSHFTYWGLEYVRTQYNQFTTNYGDPIDLRDSQKVTLNSFGLVFGVEY